LKTRGRKEEGYIGKTTSVEILEWSIRGKIDNDLAEKISLKRGKKGIPVQEKGLSQQRRGEGCGSETVTSGDPTTNL